jgi:prolipoprotein diacylglyceryltransferase
VSATGYSALATTVYALCFVTSVVCGWLLVRSFLRNRTRLLLWSAACFVLLAVNNLLVVADLVFLPTIDLSPLRVAASLAAVSTLLFGFVWEVD